MQMRRQVYRFFATLVMMLLYLSVTVGADFVSLTCRCECNHSADVHTAFAHTHSCLCEEDCHNTHDNCLGCQSSLRADRCKCMHNHSTEIKLYTQPRSAPGKCILHSRLIPHQQFLLLSLQSFSSLNYLTSLLWKSNPQAQSTAQIIHRKPL